MQWFKFYGGEYLADPKMLALSPCERSCWITLLSYAAVGEDGGRIKHLTEERLMIAAGLDVTKEEWGATSGVLDKFVSLGMVLRDSNGDITVCNWSKRQNTYLTNAERQRRYRERQKSNAAVTPPLQQSNAREKERIERKKEDASKEAGNANANPELSQEKIAERIKEIRTTLPRAKKI